LLRLLVEWMPSHMFPPDVAIRINMPVLLFTAGLALLSSLLFGGSCFADGEARNRPGHAVEYQQDRWQRARQAPA
jgi:hypothetical protein